jgi:flavin-dependent dehydrogenase
MRTLTARSSSLLRSRERTRPSSRRTRYRSSAKAKEDDGVSQLTKKIMKDISLGTERSTGYVRNGSKGAGSQTTLEGLYSIDRSWSRIKNGSVNNESERRVDFVETIKARKFEGEQAKEFDVVICGGTLGILLAAVLQREKNASVCVVERGELRGREQEWNVTRRELSVLVLLGILTESDLEEIILGEFNPIKCGFFGGIESDEIITKDVLNCGVSPSLLIAKCRKSFEDNGGIVYERTALNKVTVFENGARLDIIDNNNNNNNSTKIDARIVVDCMGFASPITLQARNGQKPDGVCVVVGTCAKGFDPKKNKSADLIKTVTDIEDSRQYFWEAFPAELNASSSKDSNDVRTTYMFSYLDAKPERPSISEMLDDYWKLMPKYQNLESINDVEIKRILFGYFTTYRDSPLKPLTDRILQIGDASGMQSPLSFGGLACMLRHLPRISLSLVEALEYDIVDQNALGSINAYQPALSAAWLFQRCMSVQVNDKAANTNNKTFINDLMRVNFQVMQNLGDDVLKPFLQDVIRFKPLARTLLSMTKNNIAFVPKILLQAGPEPIIDWFRHFICLGIYDLFEPIVEPGMAFAKDSPALTNRQKFLSRRYLEAIEYGAANDSIEKEIQRRRTSSSNKDQSD